MNIYGTVVRMYRALGIGTIKPTKNVGNLVLFMTSAVRGGLEGFQQLIEDDQVEYRVFPEEIAGANVAVDVWKR
jgi:cold shock CspA family protein